MEISTSFCRMKIVRKSIWKPHFDTINDILFLCTIGTSFGENEASCRRLINFEWQIMLWKYTLFTHACPIWNRHVAAFSEPALVIMNLFVCLFVCLIGYNATFNNFHLCNQCVSPLMLWVRILISACCTTLYDKGCQWLAIYGWCSPGFRFPPVIKLTATI